LVLRQDATCTDIGVWPTLVFHERGRDDTVDRVGTGQRDQGAGDLTHEADSAATIDETDVVLGKDAG